jgi:DNA-binding beta-propeller fold protein YncE
VFLKRLLKLIWVIDVSNPAGNINANPIKPNSMKRNVLIPSLTMLILLAATILVQAQDENYLDEEVVKVWETDPVFKTPESVYHDTLHEVLYVANINGRPTEKDNNGFISKLSPEGNVIELEWVTGLNAPKGMGMVDNYLYVTDIDRVVKIDVTNGEIVESYPGQDAVFLNDIAVGPTGIVFVSDMSTNYIYRLIDDNLEKWLNFYEYPGPNGLFVEYGQLLVGVRNQIIAIDLATDDMAEFVPRTGGIDGIEGVGDEFYIISDWQGHIYLVHPLHNKRLLSDTTPENINAADIEYNKEKKQVYVPTFNDNRVMAYDVSKVVP